MWDDYRRRARSWVGWLDRRVVVVGGGRWLEVGLPVELELELGRRDDSVGLRWTDTDLMTVTVADGYVRNSLP